MTATGPQSFSADDELPGLILFAGVVMAINGVLSVFWGLVAVLQEENVTVGGRGVVIWDFTAWGWIILVFGALVALCGIGLLAGSRAARWLGVVLVSLHALAYFGTVSAFPLWAILIIGLDVLILYQLLARWPRAA